MTNAGRFKYISASKQSQLLAAAPFKDIGSIIGSEGPVEERRLFLQSLRNTLRCKDLVKHKNALKDILQRCSLSPDHSTARVLPLAEWAYFVFSTLLCCAESANGNELRAICRLLAIFIKDYGDQGCVKVPFGALLTLIEKNVEGRADPIFSLLSTHFSVNSDHMKKDLSSVLSEFDPWLRHKHNLIRRLSMESLALLLRRLPEGVMLPVTHMLLCLESSEHLLFGIVKNVHGTVTTKTQPIFKSLLLSIAKCEVEPTDGIDALAASRLIARAVRHCLALLSQHCKGDAFDLHWLEDLYAEFIRKFKDSNISVKCAASYAIAAELAVEMVYRCTKSTGIHIKEMGLVKNGPCFEALFSQFLFPLLCFAREAPSVRRDLFNEICQLLLRVVRAECEATAVLSNSFDHVLDSIVSFVDVADINHMMPLLEWRLKSENLIHIAHCLLIISTIFNDRDLFHPLLVSHTVNTRILDCVKCVVDQLSGGGSDMLSQDAIDEELQKQMSIVFGLLKGLGTISVMRSKMKAQPPTALGKVTLEAIAKKSLDALNSTDDKRLPIEVALNCIHLMEASERSHWMGILLDTVKKKPSLLLSHRLVEEFATNFNEPLSCMAGMLETLLPHVNGHFRKACLLFFMAYFSSEGIATYSLKMLLDMESLDVSLENERKKSMLMNKSVEILDLNLGTEELKASVSVISKTLLSQYYVKFSTLWEATSEAYKSLVLKIINGFSGTNVSIRNILLESIWNDCFFLLTSDDVKQEEEGNVPDFVAPFIVSGMYESTDAVTMQREVLALMAQLISHMANKGSKLNMLVSYAHDLMLDRSKEEFRKCALSVLSMLLRKYKVSEGIDYLVEVCLIEGIRSSDPNIRESCLFIIAQKYDGIDLNRLKMIASSSDQVIPDENTDGPYLHIEEPGNRELCIGIKIRILCTRLLNNYKQTKGNGLLDHLSNLDSRYLSLLIVELLPARFSSLFLNNITDEEKGFTSMVVILGFQTRASAKPALHRGIRTIRMIVRRLKRVLTAQSVPLLKCCCIVLSECLKEQLVTCTSDIANGDFEGCNIGSVIALTISLMADLVTLFENMFDSFILILSEYSFIMETLIARYKDALHLVECLTKRTEHLESLCNNGLLRGLTHLFKGTATAELISIMENLYYTWSRQPGLDQTDKANMVSLLMSHCDAVLECIKEYKPVPANIIRGMLSLPIDVTMRQKCLCIILNNLINVRALSSHRNGSESKNYDSLKNLAYFLECIHLCVPILTPESTSQINGIWNFLNECLFYVGDLKCRRIACLILSLMPVKDEGLGFVLQHLLNMNESLNGSMDDKIDLEANCQHLTRVGEELNDKATSAKVLYTLLCHSLFVLLYGYKDPGVRRCVLNLSFVIMDLISQSLSTSHMTDAFSWDKISSNCDYMDQSDTPFVMLLMKGIFPFIQRSMSGLHIRGSLFTVTIELLENFSRKFSSDARFKVFFGNNLHGDLLCNDEIVECFTNLRGVQKYIRQKGLMMLIDLLSNEKLFSEHTTYRILIPICMQFMLQGESPNYDLFKESSRDCLVACSERLSSSTLFKFLRRLVEAYENHKSATALDVFSRILRKIPVPPGREKSSHLFSEDSNFERSQVLVQKLRRMIMRSQPGVDDLPRPEVFEALGSLLRHYSQDIREQEVLRYSRLICKCLLSRGRACRRYARLSIISFLQRMGFSFFPLVIREMSAALTRGFQIQVMIFTTHSILSSILKGDPSLTLSCNDGLPIILRMITSEIVMRQERGENKSKIDEGRHPKAITLLELLGQFGDIGVCLSICSYLWSVLKGTYNMCSTEKFEYNVKFINVCEQLLLSTVRGFLANSNLNHYCLGNTIFYGYIPYISGMRSRMEKQLSGDALAYYETCTNTAQDSLQREISDAEPATSTSDIVSEVRNNANKKREEHYMLYPGAATGRSHVSKEKSGFEEHIIAPMFVNAALKLYDHTLSRTSIDGDNVDSLSPLEAVNVSGIPDFSLSNVLWGKTALGILLCFISEDVKIQHSSARCLIHLCEGNNEFLKLCGPILSEHLIDRLGSMQMVGSEDLAKDHIRLACSFLRSDFRSLFFDAWKKSGKNNELIDGLLLQIEYNLDQPGLQVPLLKMFGILVHLEVSSDSTSKTLYEVFGEIFVRMLKGNMTPSALKASSRVVSHFLSIAPMDESNRSKRFGMLLKHITSENGVVRLTVLQCIHHFLKVLSKKGAWKRYSEMVAVAIALQVSSESDIQCKLQMAEIISLIWMEGTSDNKKGFLECIGHFLDKGAAAHKDSVYAYILFHCISKERSLSWLRKSRILEACKPFMGPLAHGDGVTKSFETGVWQAQYYWLRILFHLLTIHSNDDSTSISDVSEASEPNKFVINKTWKYAVMFGIHSRHPWIKAASLRALSYVICKDSAYNKLCMEYDGDTYNIAKAGLKLLSMKSSMVERHAKVGAALKEFLLVIMNQMVRCTTKGDDKVDRFASKLCYSLRICLGRPRQCHCRLDILLSVLHNFAGDSRVFQSFLRPTMLRVMIALTRASKCKVFYRTSGTAEEGNDACSCTVRISEAAQKIMSTIEMGFSAINEGQEYMKLLGFARDYVTRRKLLRKSNVVSSHHHKSKGEKKKRGRPAK